MVHRGVQKSDGAVFAIKTIDKTKLSLDDARMLESECDVLKAVNHPNVVRLHVRLAMSDQL